MPCWTLTNSDANRWVLCICNPVLASQTTDGLIRKWKNGSTANGFQAAHPSHPHRLPRMSDTEFEEFYRKVKAEPFSDDRNDMIKALSKNKRLTCRQCAKLLTFYSFEDEKMAAFRWFAPHLVDKENYREIQKQFTFSFEQDEVKKFLASNPSQTK